MRLSKDKSKGKIEKLRFRMEGVQKTWHPVDIEGQRDKDINERARKMELRILKEGVGSDPRETQEEDDQQEIQEEDDPRDNKDITKVNEHAKESKSQKQEKGVGKDDKDPSGQGCCEAGGKDGKK